MTIIEITGDLLTSDCDTICHGCNCFHTMGSGIALAIKKKYPEAYMADVLQTTHGDINKLGSFSKAIINNVTVYNLYQQFNYGREAGRVYIEYDKLEKAFMAMKSDLQVNDKYENCRLGMPRVGCGLARGDWSVVKQIIEKCFPQKDVYIYSL